MSRFNLAPAIDVYVGIQDRDLGSITTDIKKVVGGCAAAPAARLDHHHAGSGADHARLVH